MQDCTFHAFDALKSTLDAEKPWTKQSPQCKKGAREGLIQKCEASASWWMETDASSRAEVLEWRLSKLVKSWKGRRDDVEVETDEGRNFYDPVRDFGSGNR